MPAVLQTFLFTVSSVINLLTSGHQNGGRGVVYNLSWNDGSGWLDGSGFSLLGGSEFCVSEYATLVNYLSSYDQCLNLLSNSLIFCLQIDKNIRWSTLLLTVEMT